MGLFTDWFVNAAPAWMQRPIWAAYLGSVGAQFDAFVAGAELAVQARMPEGDPVAGVAPSVGGQNALGRERFLPRIMMFSPELNDAYGARLKNAWNDRAFSGSPEGLRIMLAYIADTMPVAWASAIYEDWNPWYSWARAWILLTDTPWVNDGTWADAGTWDDGATWDSNATPDQVVNFRAAMRSWCPPWARTDAVVTLDGEVWDEPGTWADPGTWGGHAVTWPRLET